MIHVSDELLLRPIHAQDAVALFSLTDFDRKYLREWLPWVDGTKSLKDTKNYIDLSQKGEKDGKLLNLVVIWKGDVVGVTGFNTIDHANRIGKVGYWLGNTFQGHGIMTQSVKALTDFAFNELHLNKVEIRAAVGNIKSRSIPERLGFIQEGILRSNEWLYDHFVDHAVYSVLADEWQKMQDKRKNISENI